MQSWRRTQAALYLQSASQRGLTGGRGGFAVLLLFACLQQCLPAWLLPWLLAESALLVGHLQIPAGLPEAYIYTSILLQHPFKVSLTTPSKSPHQ